MNISAKTEYACIAVFELSAHYGSGEPVRIRTIAEKHGIPSRFLVQILLQLKGSGLVSSTRGAAGGYQLVKDPQSISLLEVMQLIEGQARTVSGNSDSDSIMSRTLRACWAEVVAVQRDMLSSISFADLVERAGDETENMYYI